MFRLAAVPLLVATALQAQAATPQAPMLSDPEIAHVAVTANNIDIEAGKFALTRTHNASVKQFAQTMINDHTAVNQQATALAQKLNVTPQDNPVSQSLKKDADAAHEKLEKLRRSAFDRAYMDREIAYHQGVLDAIDKVLIPQAQNAELKSLLQNVRPAVATHLEHAKEVRAKLGGTRARKTAK
jgi:putative membrane protein